MMNLVYINLTLAVYTEQLQTIFFHDYHSEFVSSSGHAGADVGTAAQA